MDNTEDSHHQPAAGDRTHDLKTWPPFFADVLAGTKTFEVRRNDRDYRAGDLLRLREWDPDTQAYSGRETTRRVTYAMDSSRHEGVAPGHVVMGLAPVPAVGDLCPCPGPPGRGGHPVSPNDIEQAKRALAEHGYVVLKGKSYRSAQERQRRAEAHRDWAKRERESALAWARDCLADERRLRDRCTFLYGVARAHGATVEELGGSL